MAGDQACANRRVLATRFGEISDFLGRMALIIMFGALATNQTLGAIALFETGRESRLLDLAIAVLGIFINADVIGLTIKRIEPVRSGIGFEPRLSAFVGAFLAVGLVALAPANLGTGLQVTSLVLIMAGSVMSTCALLSLGRAFSVTAQARRLVVTGPYAIVRHPLYLCEEISVLGIALAHLSIAAALIVLVQWMFQLRRMTNEETVIDAAFPEYAAYAAKTPKIVPHLLSWKIRGLANWR
jgi:protein-S-isoprenylcysteine O-methyltransferase Ste14